MAEAIFPPSHNWPFPKIVSYRENGQLAYGSQNSIFILKYENNKYYPLIIKEAHSEKITSLSFSPLKSCEKFKNSLMSSSADGFVRIWNIDSLTPLVEHKSHCEPKEAAPKVICADWSEFNPQYSVSAAENNTIILWDTIGNITTRYTFQKLRPTIIECSPHDERLIACGSMKGLVYIIKLVKKGEIIHTLRGHDKEVQALSWCPLKDKTRNQFLLASSCQEKEIFIWKTNDGICETKIPLPKKAFSKSQELRKWNSTINLTPVFWAEPYTLYSATKYGELISCDLRNFLTNSNQNGEMNNELFNKNSNCWKLIHCLHSNIVTAIIGMKTKNTAGSTDNPDNCDELLGNQLLENDIKGKSSTTKEKLIWTLGKDRRIIGIIVNSVENNVKFNFHTLNGHQYEAAVSPHDPNKIAFAGSDGMIRLWSASGSSGCNIRSFWEKINDKVYSLAWHPTREGLLAFGTSEGRIGLKEMYTSKQPMILTASQKGAVYGLSWGPRFSENGKISSLEKKDYCLYCHAKDKLYMFDPLNIESGAALDLTEKINSPCKKISDLSWKPDFSLLALGCADGSIILLRSPNLITYQVLLGSRKNIYSIVWHPMTTTVDADCSGFQGYLTFSSENVVKVYNCTINDGQVVDQISALKGHTGNLQSASWSPHIAGRLITTSSDFTIRIWDVTKNVQILKFYASQNILPLFCTWSPIDPDVLIAGFAERCLMSWRISSTSNNNPIFKDSRGLMERKKIVNLTGTLLISEEEKNRPVGNGTIKSHCNASNNLQMAKQDQNKTNEAKLFKKAWNSDKDSFQHCYDLLKGSENEENDVNHILPLLGAENQFTEFLSLQAESCQKSNEWNNYYVMSLWSGNLNEVIEEKIKTGHLDDFLVSLAPYASPRLWKEACSSYAKSLTEMKMYRKAASYLLAIHQVNDAIDLLLKANLYLEAITIARCRLTKSDPVYVDAIRKYAEYLVTTGCYLKACECFIFLKEYAEIATLLRKKNQVDYQSLAAFASKKAGLESLERECSHNALIMCLESQKWELASRICSDHENLKHLSILYEINKEIHRIDTSEKVLEKDLIDHLCELIGTQGDLDMYDSLGYIYDRNAHYFDKKKLHLTLAQELALACCAGNKETQLTHIIRGMNACSKWINKSSGNDFPLFKFCSWLCSDKYLSEKSIFSWSGGSEKCKIKSLRAFLCQGIVEYLENVYSQKSEDIIDKIMNLEVILIELIDNALDRDAFKYFKNQLDVIACEKEISETHRRLNGRTLESSDNSDLEIKNNNLGSSSAISQETSSKEEESQNLEGLNNFITTQREKMNQLKEEMENFEKSSILAPNPAVLYCSLRRVSEMLCNPECSFKNVVEDKWKELEKI